MWRVAFSNHSVAAAVEQVSPGSRLQCRYAVAVFAARETSTLWHGVAAALPARWGIIAVEAVRSSMRYACAAADPGAMPGHGLAPLPRREPVAAVTADALPGIVSVALSLLSEAAGSSCCIGVSLHCCHWLLTIYIEHRGAYATSCGLSSGITRRRQSM